jgi:hypothetical protein
MPLYFFHLSFGQRVIPDEEGVKLPNRSAARDEALAAVRELGNRRSEGASRRWAGWFLQLADERGNFFRTPIGQPALDIVRPGFQLATNEASQHPQVQDTEARSGRATMLATELSERRQRMAELREQSRQLRHHISCLYLISEGLIIRTQLALERARAIRGR